MKKFLVCGTPRTGSSAVVQLINLAPHFLCGFEWTSKMWRGDKIKIATRLLNGDKRMIQKHMREDVLQKPLENLQWIGFKLLFRASNKFIVHPKFSVALWADDLTGHMVWLRKNPDIKIIHIVRNNNIEWLKSYFLSKLTKMYSNMKYPEGLKVKIGAVNAFRRVRSKHWIDRQISSLKNTHSYLRVDYENFANDYKETAYGILNFFESAQTYCSIDFESFRSLKQSNTDAKGYISNFEQLYCRLKRENLLFAD